MSRAGPVKWMYWNMYSFITKFFYPTLAHLWVCKFQYYMYVALPPGRANVTCAPRVCWTGQEYILWYTGYILERYSRTLLHKSRYSKIRSNSSPFGMTDRPFFGPNRAPKQNFNTQQRGENGGFWAVIFIIKTMSVCSGSLSHAWAVFLPLFELNDAFYYSTHFELDKKNQGGC